MCRLKEIDFGLNCFFKFWRYGASFSGEPLFRYAQSDSARTSFPGSTVIDLNTYVIHKQNVVGALYVKQSEAEPRCESMSNKQMKRNEVKLCM